MNRSVYSLLGVACGLLALELLVRQVYCLRQVMEPGYGLVPEPGSTVVWGREGHAKSRWTYHGIRRASLPRPTEPAVLIVGDSQTEALMVGDDEAFPSLTEASLKEDGAQMPAILNSGRSSASMADYVVGAPRFERLFAPRWVVIEIQESDLCEDAFDQGKAHFVDEASGTLGVVPEKTKTRSVLNALLWTLRQNSMLIGYAAVRVVEFSRPTSSAPPLFRAGVSLPVLAPPTAYPVEAELDLAESVYRGRVSFLFLSPFDPKEPSGPSPFERRFLDHCVASKLHCLTPRAEYPAIAREGHAPYGHENTRFNFGHLNRIGHRAVAAALTRHLRELRADGLL